MQVIITIDKDNKLGISQSGNLSYDQLTDVLATAQLSLMENMRSLAASNEHNIDEHLFDTYNMSASNVLDTFMPEHMRRDITEEAIIKEEDRILNQAYLKVVK